MDDGEGKLVTEANVLPGNYPVIAKFTKDNVTVKVKEYLTLFLNLIYRSIKQQIMELIILVAKLFSQLMLEMMVLEIIMLLLGIY